MAKRKTSAELLEEARRADARAKELRRKAQEATKAEQAKLRKELCDAVEEWRVSWPEAKRYAPEDLPGYFRQQAERNRQRFGGNNNG